MKVLTFSRQFPKGHPKEGHETYFAEKIWNSFRNSSYSLPPHIAKLTGQYPFKGDEYLQACERIKTIGSKYHTIRAGSRFKPGDMASLRVWQDKPYRSKQIEFAQVEVKKTWEIEIWLCNRISIGFPEIPGVQLRLLPLCEVAENDGLECMDFEAWFRLHPKKNGKVFSGQIICWDVNINYGKVETN